METENKNGAATLEALAHGRMQVTLRDDGFPSTVVLTTAELQAIVQAAYDQHGIIAEPSLEVERRESERRADEAEDTHLRSFADAWGDSMRNQS